MFVICISSYYSGGSNTILARNEQQVMGAELSLDINDWHLTGIDLVALSLSGLAFLIIVILALVTCARSCKLRRSHDLLDNESWATPYSQYEHYSVSTDTGSSSLIANSAVCDVITHMENSRLTQGKA